MKTLVLVLALCFATACTSTGPVTSRTSLMDEGSWERECRRQGGVVYITRLSTKCVDRHHLQDALWRGR